MAGRGGGVGPLNQIEKVVEKPKSGGQGQVATQAWLHQAQKSWTPKAPPASGEGPQGRQQHVRPRRLPAPTTPTSGHGTWLPGGLVLPRPEGFSGHPGL